MYVRWSCFFFFAAIPFISEAQVFAPVPTATNSVIRVMAANLTSGNNQRYETPGLNIMKGLKPDVVAIQEFDYLGSSGESTATSLREMIDNTFGPTFVYYRESGKNIPNGVISRYPILASGVWDDVQVSDREFVWTKLDIPGTNELYVISVHLHSGGGSSSRAIEANNLKTYIQANIPTNAFIVLAGDFNTDSRSEQAISIFKTFLSDSPIPVDQAGDADTNANRNKPYDYVLASFSLSTNQVPTVIGTRSFANGLVFDSRVFTPLPSPVQSGDSGASGMQHMAVVKDFRIYYTTTNFVAVTAPRFVPASANALNWIGQSNLTYTVQTSTNLTAWFDAGTAFSSSTNFSFALPVNPVRPSFYRVRYP